MTNPAPATDAVPRSVGRAFELLEAVVDAGSMTLTEAAAQVGLTPTTALRHLRALEALGYLHRAANGDYGAGPASLRLAARCRDDGPLARLITAAGPVLDELAAATGESSYLAVVDRDQARYIATAESTQAIRHVGWVGRAVPLDNTAVGAALSGASGPQHRTSAIESDISAVAVAVRDGDDVVAALSVIGPTYRLDADAVDAVSDRLRWANDRLSVALDLSPPPDPTDVADPIAPHRAAPHPSPKRASTTEVAS